MEPALKLKSLILCGFKSFADKTVFEFHEGMTVLVGPNGCGKSNIVDAIKWVLGDQSAKSVRGKEMTDVIFNGSDKRPPLGVAEVSLVFGNSGHQLPIDYDTVMVTRKLYRDGHSEYEINRNSCRLKDIRELFLDTGIGVDAYSIIEQGRVASFIQANAKERRQLFEEASGISRLKARKKEALAKLNRSQQNLERLHDIVEEVSRRLTRVKRQAVKAQKFQELSDVLKNKKITVSVFDYRQLKNEEAGARQKLDHWEDQLASIQKEQGSFDAQRLEIDDQLGQSHQQVQRLSTELVKIDGELQRLTDLIEMHQRQSETTLKEKNRRQEHLHELERRHQEVLDQTQQLKTRVQELVEKIEQSDKAVNRAEQNVEAQEEILLEYSSRLEALRSRLHSDRSQQERLTHLDQTNQVRLERLQREINEASLKSKSFQGQKDLYQQRRRALEARLQDCGYQKMNFEKSLKDQEILARQLDTEVSQCDGQLTEIRLEKSRKLTEKRVLEDLEKHHAGLSEAVKALLNEGRHHPQLLTGLIGLAAELVTAPPAVARAVDAALGAGAQIVVVDELATMIQAEKILEEKALGQVAFAPLSALPALNLPPERHDFPHSGRLVDQIQVDSEYRLLFEHLLGVWYLVDEQTDLSQIPSGVSVVTASGRRRGPRGTYVLGPAGETTGLVSRRSSLNEFEEVLAELESQENRLHQELKEFLTRQKQHETNRSDLASELMKTENLIADRRSDLHVLEQEERLLNDRRQRLEERLKNLTSEQEVLLKEQRGHQEQLKQLALEIPQRQDEISHIDQLQKEAYANQQKEREALISTRLQHSSLDNERQRLTSSLHHHQDNLKDLDEDKKRLQEEDIQSEQHLKTLAQESQEARQQIEAFFSQKAVVEASLSQARQERAAIERQKKSIDEVLGNILPRLREAQEEVSQNQIKQREAAFKRESLIDRLRDDYHLDLAQIEADWETPESFDLESWRQECDSLKNDIESLGSVNLEALEEETELDERHAFLADQEKDLREATLKLKNVVEKIDTRARELFTSTFEMVREHFRVTFRQLFGGGRADLKFESDQEDILEAGIEITACPPGKEPRSITLLSGGEKTMTAVALLFAVFKSRPSPFCVLDEVDAALDESNIDRWLSMLSQFKNMSQFLVITHSKRTMKDASMIYGVTMQEPGVSCKLSLKFEEIDERKDLSSLPDNKVA